ncbi:MAG: hypothetical protein ACYC4L_09575, partial [Chloroflexota bacterium]
MGESLDTTPNERRRQALSRRGFLGMVAALGATAVVAGCQQGAAPAATATKAPAAAASPAATAAATKAATTAATQAPAGGAKKLAGVTLNGSLFQHPYSDQIKALTPEFEALTGAKVNIEIQVFANYNQKMDLELSTKGSAYDFCNATFIYTGKWIGAGWFTDLEPFIA